MPRIIFKCPYIKPGTAKAVAHLNNYVRYVATRDGTDLLKPDKAGQPATKKQRAMVERLLRDFPLCRGMFEYEDYQSSPTRAAASEFITRAIEDNYDQIAKRENYVSYIAQRPRAERLGAHGLFNGTGDALELSRIAEEVANHPGNVWLPIISLRREDAARLGYDNARQWQALLSTYAPQIADAMNIPWEQFRWYASYHDEGSHPHVHMVCYSADGRSGFLDKEGIARIKSGLAKNIFRQELTEIYRQQTQRRDDLVRQSGEVMKELIRQMLSGTLENPRIEQLMGELAQRLKSTSGKKQYGYCADCGKPLVLHRASTMKKTKYNFQCYTFGKRGKGNCSPHHIREMDLMKIVLDDIRRVTHSARTQERQFAQYINQKNSVELRREMNVLQKELDTMRKRNSELSLLFKRLYEDHVLGRVTAEQFRMLSSDYNAEQKALEDAIPEKEARLEKLRASAANVDTFIEKAKRYTAIDELTPELLRLFIQRIEVGERSKKYSRSAAQSVRIIYRDIGSMDRPMEPKVLQPHDTPEVSNPVQIPA